jgi:amino-acid N-acetyltransferase
MDEQKLKGQVELIRQVFGYVDQFRGKTFVIKIDSAVVLHPLFSILVKDLVLLHRMGIRVILVPGTKNRIDEILKQYHVEWEIIDGVRVSSPQSMSFIKMAAFDISNELMTLLAESKTDGVIGNWVKARAIGIRGGVDFQRAGVVDKVKTAIVRSVLDQGMIPIFPNIGWNARGKPYNVSSDELATAISSELSAEKLFFIRAGGGISGKEHRLPEGIEPNREGTVSRLTLEETDRFLALNREKEVNELLHLISLARSACRRGVKRVHIVDGSVEGVILKEIFSNQGVGTMIYSDEHAHIRTMNHGDIPEVLRIMQPLVDKDYLIPRTSGLLEERAKDFVVYEVDGIIHACGALHVYAGGKGEIAALAVDETYANMGIGEKIVTYLIERAKRLRIHRVFVLTTQAADWFFDMGFRESDQSQLPGDKRADYDTTRNSAVLTYDLEET